MGAFIDILRSGRWLTRERLRLWALAVLAASSLGFLYIVATSDGLNDYQNRPIGTDYSNVYAANRKSSEPTLRFTAGTIHRSSCSSRVRWR
jgi:alpha-1,2-mannosyltransferase